MKKIILLSLFAILIAITATSCSNTAEKEFDEIPGSIDVIPLEDTNVAGKVTLCAASGISISFYKYIYNNEIDDYVYNPNNFVISGYNGSELSFEIPTEIPLKKNLDVISVNVVNGGFEFPKTTEVKKFFIKELGLEIANPYYKEKFFECTFTFKTDGTIVTNINCTYKNKAFKIYFLNDSNEVVSVGSTSLFWEGNSAYNTVGHYSINSEFSKFNKYNIASAILVEADSINDNGTMNGARREVKISFNTPFNSLSEKYARYESYIDGPVANLVGSHHNVAPTD